MTPPPPPRPFFPNGKSDEDAIAGAEIILSAFVILYPIYTGFQALLLFVLEDFMSICQPDTFVSEQLCKSGFDITDILKKQVCYISRGDGMNYGVYMHCLLHLDYRMKRTDPLP